MFYHHPDHEKPIDGKDVGIEPGVLHEHLEAGKKASPAMNEGGHVGAAMNDPNHRYLTSNFHDVATSSYPSVQGTIADAELHSNTRKPHVTDQ